MNKVLIVDDEPIIIETMANMVKKLEFEPLIARSACEAIAVFNTVRPGIVISDLCLGGNMDGIALCSKLLYDDHTVIMIAMSGVYNQYDKAYCLSAGYTDFLIKPITMIDLESAINCAFTRRSRWMRLP